MIPDTLINLNDRTRMGLIRIENLEQWFVEGAEALPKSPVSERFLLFGKLSLITKEVRRRWIRGGKSPDVASYKKVNAVYLRLCSYLFTLHQHLGIREQHDARKLLGGGPSYYTVRVISFNPTGITVVVKNGAGQKQEVDVCDLRPIEEFVQ